MFQFYEIWLLENCNYLFQTLCEVHPLLKFCGDDVIFRHAIIFFFIALNL